MCAFADGRKVLFICVLMRAGRVEGKIACNTYVVMLLMRGKVMMTSLVS
jgi:hypothetical protein